jgi:cell division protein FtsZ
MIVDKQNTGDGNRKNDEFIPVDWPKQQGSIIKVIGVGGCGNNAVKNMYLRGIEGVDFVVCNTDAQVLRESPVPNKIQIGVILTHGLGSGCNPEIGRNAAIENLDEIKKILSDNAEMVFITAGMGGGTGTGAAPVIAKEAKEMGILTVAIVTMPFEDEGDDSRNRALDGLHVLRQYVDSLLIINNEKIYEIYPDLPVFDALPKVDDILATAAKGIAEIITKTGYINVDFADVRMVMKDSGMALMGTGRASGPNRAEEAAKLALTSPLLNDNNISGAKNILINISSGEAKPIITSELKGIMDYIRAASGGKTNFKRGVNKDPDLGEDIEITIIATGFSMQDVVDVGEVQEPIVRVPFMEYLDGEIRDVNKTIDLTPDLDPEIVIRTIPEGYELKSAIYDDKGISPLPQSRNLSQLKDRDIAQLEDEPAYLRNNVNIDIKIGAASEISSYKLDENEGEYTLSEDNAFLNKNVD